MPQRRPLPPPSSPALAFNRSEWIYAASEGPIGQLNQSYLLRFDAPLSADLAKRAIRRLVSALPRLRGVLEPTARRHRLRILPDDDALDVQVDLAFRVEQIDLDAPEALRRWHELALNDPLPLQRGLGVRAQFVPHPERPALMWTVHHLLADGRSMVMAVQMLIKLLNGQAVNDMPLDSPSMLPAVLPPHWWQVPAKLWAAWRCERGQAREQQRHEVIRLPGQRMSRYLGVGVHHHDLGWPTADIARAAKGRGGSANSLLMAAAATALLDLDGNRAGTAALVRLSVDLRRYFPPGRAPQMGNHVATANVLLPADVPEAERVRWMDARVRQALQRFADHTMVLPLLPYEWLGWLRTHDYTRLLMRAKRLDFLPQVSCHATNLGTVADLNPPDAHVRLTDLYPIVSANAPLLAFVGVEGRQVMVCSHQRDEHRDADMLAWLRGIGAVLARWLQPLPA